MNIFRRYPRSPIESPAGFKDLYERSRMAVFRYIFALTGGPQDDVEDLTAETFLRAWKARHRFEGDPNSAIGWLIQIAKRLVIDSHRRSLQTARDRIPDPPAGPALEQIVIDDEQHRFLLTLLDGLPDEQREIIILRYVLGWRVNEIARHMDVTENNVSVTIHRTLSRLKEKWMELESMNMPAVINEEEKIS